MIDALWVVHPDEEMCAAYRERFTGLPNVRIVNGLFEHVEPHDCFVTAGNAFGLMSAGIDAAAVRRFGEQLVQRVQQKIMDDYLGEQPVGTAFIVPLEAFHSARQPDKWLPRTATFSSSRTAWTGMM